MCIIAGHNTVRAKNHCIVILLTLYLCYLANKNIFIGCKFIEGHLNINIFKKSLYFQPYEQKVQKYILGYTKQL